MKVAVEALGRGYVARGAQRLLIVPGALNRRVETEAGTVVQIKAPEVVGGYRMIVGTRAVLDALDAFRPTSIELSDKWSLMPVCSWARRNGIPTVMFSHERLDVMLPQRLNARDGLRRSMVAPIGAYNTWLRRSVDAVVVTSEFAAAEFVRERGGLPPVHRVPLGVDLEAFAPSFPTLSTTPTSQPTSADPLRLVHSGRLSREKHPVLSVMTAAELHRRGVSVRLDVYGDGPQRRELEEIANGAPVRFHGFVPSRSELCSALASADIALSPSPGETFGLAVLEALACGTPVVTADTGGARELVDESCGAWGAPTPAALADAVLRLAARNSSHTSQAARRRAELYPWAASVDAMLALHLEPRWSLSRSA